MVGRGRRNYVMVVVEEGCGVDYEEGKELRGMEDSWCENVAEGKADGKEERGPNTRNRRVRVEAVV